ncbi:hypothetical protein P3T37_000145 [Kitasatospora sp. MAA4]|uniref:toll/interleukin-1 receptor domain-containing protein n=1 Tax=Kitasatospora sp. MAA4 TaxID=3035093 RepID=UPI0024755421|nr:toll/interleukin-1 receptor domain-containing protein [Kitasatospora sp. MAA4]MDH6130778.1 hypothetical protein [Kitasatospora sp. MAA4]
MTEFWGRAALGKIFISHSSVDKPFVRRGLDAPLREAGYDTWLDEKELLLGDPLPRKVSEGLRSAKVVLVVISAASVKSSWLTYELNIATDLMINEGLRLIPVVIDDAPIPAELKGLLYADMRADAGSGWTRLLTTLESEASRYPRPPDPASVASGDSYQRGRAYKKLLNGEADGGYFSASMDLSVTRSVDWYGITVREVDIRVDVVHSYSREVVLDTNDFKAWLGQLEEISSSFGILLLEGRISHELASTFEQPVEGVWTRVVAARPFSESGAQIVVEVGAEKPVDQTEARLREAVRLMVGYIEDRKPSMYDAFTAANKAKSD